MFTLEKWVVFTNVEAGVSITSACAAGTAVHQKTCLSLSAAAEGDTRNPRAGGCPCSAELVPGGLYHSLQNRRRLPREKSRGQIP